MRSLNIQQVEAARNIYKEEFSERVEAIQAAIQTEASGRSPAYTLDEFGYLIGYLRSIQAFVNSANKLESQVGRRPYRVGAGPGFFNSLEFALKARLEALKRRPGSDS